MASISLKYKSKQGNLTAPGDVDPGAMIPIATTALTTSATTVTFSNIPNYYEHLQIRAISRVDAADNGRSILVQFNGDTGANYAYHLLYGNGSSAAATGAASQNNMTYQLISAGANATSGIFGGGILDILDYANTNKFKTTRSISGLELNIGSTDSQARVASGLWQSTNAITSITLTSAVSGNFIANSHFALYGIKRAGA